MSFASLVFFAFLAIYLSVSVWLPVRQWRWWALLSSSVFYGYWDWRFLLLIYGLAIVSWYCAKRMSTVQTVAEKKPWLLVAVVSALVVLGIFKYFNFFISTFLDITAAFGLPLRADVAKVILPVGISFYTFQALSYTIDLYRGHLHKPATLLEVAVFLSFFPQLVAGPIVRASIFIPQVRRGPLFRFRNIKVGLLLIAWGYFLKLCLADFAGLTIDRIFVSPNLASSPDLIASIIAYAFQIYGDFAGYSFIAIGIAKLQGFNFPANFAAPYLSRSFSEFWTRWHISLSSWLRDYLYIPLGGNRGGKLKEYRNLMTTMLLGGLWHGASWNFVLWGFLHGIYLVGQRLVGFRYRPGAAINGVFGFVTQFAQVTGVFCLVLLTWIFFRIRDLDGALAYLGGIFAFDNMNLSGISNRFEMAQIALLIVVTVAVDLVFFRRRRLVRFLRSDVAVAIALATLACTLQLVGTFGGGAFIYFQF